MTTILVTGDVAIDYLQWAVNKPLHVNSNEDDDWKYYDNYKIERKGGGALLQYDMIKAFNSESLIPIDCQKARNEPGKFINSFCLLEKFRPNINNDNDELKNLILGEKDDKLVLEKLKSYKRKKCGLNLVKSFSGFKFPEGYVKNKPIVSRLDPHIDKADIVIIHDAGFYFRYFNHYWPKSILNADDSEDDTLYVLKMDKPLSYGYLWDSIKLKQNLIVMIRANDLREKGLRISRSLSWERTAYDFRKEFDAIINEDNLNKLNSNQKKIKQLSRIPNLIIRFGVDGAILYQYNNGDPRYTLFYDPEVFEGGLEYRNEGYYMNGMRSAFVSGLVYCLQNNPKKIEDAFIKKGIKNGILISRDLLNRGFSSDENNTSMNYPLREIFKDINCNNETEFKIQDVPIPPKNKSWKIIEKKLESEENIYNSAKDFVKEGENSILQAPVVNFGKLRTADRSEIESFHSIKNLITEYLKKKTKVPLSIAVFGPPGAGKSFGVTELAKTISDKIKKIEFNISQFESPKDLFSAFHIVQSTSLKGKIPLVFFDEFDCNLDGVEYGWLRYFLSPMNDGSFKQGDTIHPIGKCIFVFAGGTKSTFAEFDADKTKLKGSDFVSRLRGYVNIMGLNQFERDITSEYQYKNRKLERKDENENNSEDFTYMIRRAVALRTILEKNAENIFSESKGIKFANIDDAVLNAFIRVPEYKHGVRSMEAIVEMSILPHHRNKFERSALPSSEQLELHVNTKEFKKCLDHPKCKKKKKSNSRMVSKRKDGKWVNKNNESDRASSIHDTQQDAIDAAKRMLKNQGGGELSIKGRNGKIRDKITII